MPNQTTLTTYVHFPDGAKVSVKASGDGSYTDLGAIQTAVTATLNYDENQVETANAGKLAKQIRNMTIAGGFTLINLNPTGVQKLGGGIFELATTTSSPVTVLDNQVIASGAAANKTPYNLSLIDASDNSIKASAEPTIASVTGATDGALAANDDYELIVDANSPSGYSIVFNTAGSSLTTMAQEITIVFTSVTPIASTIMYAGSSTEILTAYAMKITHTDDNGKIRQLELYAVDPDSGGFQFNFKGANEDGVEEMPLTYTAKLDTTKTSGRQLMAWTEESGAA